jgi:sugar phosphate isomerase/epimerase
MEIRFVRWIQKAAGAAILATPVLFAMSLRPAVEKPAEQGGLAWSMGVALFSFHHHPLGAALAMTDSAGVKWVEGFTQYKLGKAFNDSAMGALSQQGRNQVKRLLKEHGMQMHSIYVEGAKDVHDWKRFFEIARDFHAQYIVCEPAKAHLNMVDSLAGEYKIRVAIHNHAKHISAYWHPDSVLAALKGHPNLGACGDLGHWARSGLNPARCLQQLRGHVLEIHLKDIDVFDDVNAKDVDVGTGVIHFGEVVDELKRQHFHGVMYVECEHNMDNNLGSVEEAIRYITRLAK